MTGYFAQLVKDGVEERVLERLRHHGALESTQTERESDPLKSPVVQAGEDSPLVRTAFTLQSLHGFKVENPGEILGSQARAPVEVRHRPRKVLVGLPNETSSLRVGELGAKSRFEILPRHLPSRQMNK